MNNNNKPAQGFSLLELMISLAIMAILVQFSVPSYKAYMGRASGLELETKAMEQEIIELTRD